MRLTDSRLLRCLCLAFGLWQGSAAQDDYHLAEAVDQPELVSSWIDRHIHYHPRMAGACAGVVSHHLLAGTRIAGFFQALADSRQGLATQRIVILSPDHFHRARAPIVTSAWPWRTQNGWAGTDADWAKTLDGVAFENDPFLKEHGIGALVPFVAEYFPGTRIVPVLLHQSASQEALDRFAGSLIRQFDEGTVILVSADFVHEESSTKAQRLDRRSLRVMKELMREPRFEVLDGITADNRRGLYVLAKVLSALGRPGLELLERTDAALLVKMNVPVTSYMFIVAGGQ
jgi:AmmeMemoRadiSam system protein B